MKYLFLTFVLVLGLVAGGSAHAAHTSQVIKFVAVHASEQHPTKSRFIIRENDFVNGKRAGHDTLACSIVSQARAKCTIVVELATGTIKAKLVVSFTAPGGRGTITGGTGAYAGAQGVLVFRSLNKQHNRTSVVLTLR